MDEMKPERGRSPPGRRVTASLGASRRRSVPLSPAPRPHVFLFLCELDSLRPDLPSRVRVRRVDGREDGRRHPCLHPLRKQQDTRPESTSRTSFPVRDCWMAAGQLTTWLHRTDTPEGRNHPARIGLSPTRVCRAAYSLPRGVFDQDAPGPRKNPSTESQANRPSTTGSPARSRTRRRDNPRRTTPTPA
jgi:hypothetical protein